MRFEVIADPPAEFEAWLVRQLAPGSTPTSEAAARGARLFNDRTCVQCHAVRGTGPLARVAPDLTHLASRTTLGAGVLTNTPDHLAAWLKDPQSIKPGCHMPSLRLEDGDAKDLAAYLGGLP
jgi:cytochrome c oxidase subunit 2